MVATRRLCWLQWLWIQNKHKAKWKWNYFSTRTHYHLQSSVWLSKPPMFTHTGTVRAMVKCWLCLLFFFFFLYFLGKVWKQQQLFFNQLVCLANLVYALFRKTKRNDNSTQNEMQNFHGQEILNMIIVLGCFFVVAS